MARLLALSEACDARPVYVAMTAHCAMRSTREPTSTRRLRAAGSV
jgi:hypothetical protein